MKNKVVNKEYQLDESVNDISRTFEAAVTFVKSLPAKGQFQPSYSDAAKIYSYYKQAKFGTCDQSKPNFWDVVNKAKWDAWSSLGDMPKEEAMMNYVEEVKKICERFKDSDDFSNKEAEYADILIPFCHATHIPLTSFLKKYVKRNPSKFTHDLNDTKNINGNSHHTSTLHKNNNHHSSVINENTTHENTGRIQDNDVVVVIENVNDDKNNQSQNSANENSILFEKTFVDSYTPKVVSFKVNGDVNGTGDEVGDDITQDLIQNKDSEPTKNDGESSEEEVYCDTLDPDQASLISAMEHSFEVSNSHDLSSSSSGQGNASTPLVKTKSAIAVNGKDISGSETSKSDFEIVDKNDSINSIGIKLDHPIVTTTSILHKKDAHFEVAATVVRKKCDILDEFEKTYPSKHNSKRNHHCNRNNYKPPELNHVGVRNYKRHVHSAKNEESSKNQSSSSDRQNVGRQDGSSSFNNMSSRYTRHRQSSGSSDNNGSDDGDTYTSISSTDSSDNIGLKIVQALERMEENLHLVLDRLDSIENNIKSISKRSSPSWWHEYIPSKSVTFFIAWPVIVNIILYLMWRRKMKQNFRRC